MANELLTKNEELYFELLFDKNLDVDSSLRFLRESGVAATRPELVRFKQKTLESLIDMKKEEHMSELMLTSFERIKLEFDDLINETKRVLEISKDTDKPDLALGAIRELRAQLETAMSQQNKQAEQLIQIMKEKREYDKQNKEVHEILKQEKERWLQEYNATVTDDKKIIFENPTPEFVDFVTRWKFQKEMLQGKVSEDV